VRISVPVSRANLDELTAMRDWFMERGAHEVVFDPMASRCMEDRSLFDRLSLAPARVHCTGAVTRDLIVDCDGTVVVCCNDFARERPIGNLAVESFRETLQSFARSEFARTMDEGRHDEVPLCTRCFGDVRTPAFPFDHPVANQPR